MSSASREQDHLAELEVFLLLSRSERMSVEERKYRSLQVASIDRVSHDAAVRALGRDTTTTEELLQHRQDDDVLPVLVSLEHRRHQPAPRRLDRGVRSDAHGEASLAIDEARDVVGGERAMRPS